MIRRRVIRLVALIAMAGLAASWAAFSGPADVPPPIDLSGNECRIYAGGPAFDVWSFFLPCDRISPAFYPRHWLYAGQEV